MRFFSNFHRRIFFCFPHNKIKILISTFYYAKKFLSQGKDWPPTLLSCLLHMSLPVGVKMEMDGLRFPPRKVSTRTRFQRKSLSFLQNIIKIKFPLQLTLTSQIVPDHPGHPSSRFHSRWMYLG